MAIPGYNLFRNDRTSAPGGGVNFYLRQTLPCTRLFQCEQPDVESLWLSLWPHILPRAISSIILCVVYRSTANGQPENVVLSNHIRSNLDSLLMKQPNALVVIGGDFNPTSTGLKLKAWRNQLVWRSTVLKIVLGTIILERERSQGSSFFALARSGSEQSFRIKFAMKFLKWNENCLSHSYSGRSKLVLYFVMYISRHLLRRHCIVYLLIVDVYTQQWNTCMVVGRILPANNHLFRIVKCFYSRRSRPIVYLTVI